jgi:hypothetical protein
MPPPSSLTVVYATDEDVVALAGDDFQVLAGRWHRYAGAADGVFAAGIPWVLTSASSDFVAQGVLPNMVIQLLKPVANFPGSGDLLAVETVTTDSLTLRRVGEAVGVGQPPAPAAGLAGVTFLITSLRRQLEDASYQLNEQFSIDPMLPSRTPGDIYDLRIMRRLVVYQVVLRRYMNANRTAKGDFADKVEAYSTAFESELATATLRWGPTGQSQPTSTRFSTRVTR